MLKQRKPHHPSKEKPSSRLLAPFSSLLIALPPQASSRSRLPPPSSIVTLVGWSLLPPFLSLHPHSHLTGYKTDGS
ncbi:hypothetical protein TIFTF001_007144 [Ficus carica]|uniref:Uncharacterized protein n=1 Tax=Ficus carica TaxID=3494 RepID=A0AA88A292_FICCA|nr:hypothetical protein TIFTF001_007144 [Ficus carica]